MTDTVTDALAMEALGQRLAQACHAAAVIYLHGPLGAGKTTLVRGFIRGLGFTGAVKSPTYTLIEPYEQGVHRIFHLDLYRIRDPEELEYLGLRELEDERAIVLVEWPERGQGFLPPADLDISIAYSDDGRQILAQAHSPVGMKLKAAAFPAE